MIGASLLTASPNLITSLQFFAYSPSVAMTPWACALAMQVCFHVHLKKE
jgi:hypothetical protein